MRKIETHFKELLKKVKKGFTLVEMLGVIVIVGLIVVIVIPFVSNVINGSKEKLYSQQLKNIELAAKTWGSENLAFLPKMDGSTVTIFLYNLKSDGFIVKDINNPVTGDSIPNDLAIEITKVGKAYKYVAVLESGGTSVFDDFSAPRMILNGAINQHVELNGIFPGFSTDDVTLIGSDGYIVNNFSINASLTKENLPATEVEVDNPGIYYVKYEVIYEGYNLTVFKKITVADTLPPVITFTSSNSIFVDSCPTFDPQAGVIVTDNSGEWTLDIAGTLSCEVGKYELTYTATDIYGNTSVKKREMSVEPSPASYTVTYTATNGGSVTVPSRTVYENETSAAPGYTMDPGYDTVEFERILGSGGTLNSQTGEVTNVTGDQTIRANFSISDPILALIIQENYLPISTVADVQAIGQGTSRTWGTGTAYETTGTGNMNTNYVLTNNINMGGITLTPIGDGADQTYTNFTGIFDGFNYVISNATLNQPSDYHIGFFAGVSGTIRNLGMTGITVNGYYRTGIIAGRGTNAIIENCYTSGSITSGGTSGGIIGRLDGGSVTNSYSSATFTGANASYVGGLIGFISGATVSESYATGNLTTSVSNGYAESWGGLVGDVGGGSLIENSYATGIVDGGSTASSGAHTIVGGLVGRNYNSTIQDSYATGTVYGQYVGGLVGENGCYPGPCSTTVVNSYSIGLVVLDTGFSSNSTGGLIGQHGIYGECYPEFDHPDHCNPPISSVYYDSTTSGQSDTGKGIPRTTTQMRQQATFTDWNFTSIWTINETVDYPKLWWE